MSTDRDFDRVARAWLDLSPTEAPDRAIAAALDAIDATPQVRRPLRWPFWRPSPMTRLPLLAALAGLIIVAGAVLFTGSPPPVPMPSPTQTTSPAPAVTAAPGAIPERMHGGWVAASRGTSIEDPAVTFIRFGPSSDEGPIRFWLDRAGFGPLVAAEASETSPGVVRLVAQDINGGCAVGDTGSYAWSVTADGRWLRLELLEDTCARRTEILPGTWQRSLAHDSSGGPGIAAAFTPYFTFSLPPDTYTGYGLEQTDTLVTETASSTFKLWKDLDGFVDPCDDGPGRIDLDGLDGFLGYLRDDPRFDVIREEEFTIDGRRAVQVHFRVGDAIEPPCWNLDDDPADKTGVLTWAPSADETRWNFAIGSEGALVVTELDGVSLVFEPLIVTGSTFEVDRATLDTIRFLDGLPTPPEG
jgi:hypothetical protein